MVTQRVKLIAVGDIFLRTRNNKYPFENIKETLKNKDILFGNLETVLSSKGKAAEKAVLLYSSPKNAKHLKSADFDVLNIANNHIFDLGIEGFSNTLDVLYQNDLTYIGANNKPGKNYVILERKGIKFGFLGYTQGGFSLPEKGIRINKIEAIDIIKDIEYINPQCEFVIISLHWGTENVFYPSPKQINLAHKLIDAGATVILGHHPHVIQGIERYKTGLIAYSLGNFQFDPKLSYSETNKSIILCLNFDRKKIESYEIISVMIDKDFLPGVAEGKLKDKVSDFITKISQSLDDGHLTERWWFEEIAGEYLSSNMKSWIIRIKKYGIRHFFQCIKWLISPFTIRCYMGFLSRKLKGRQVKNDQKPY